MRSTTTEGTAVCDGLLTHHFRIGDDEIRTSCYACRVDAPATHSSHLMRITDSFGGAQNFRMWFLEDALIAHARAVELGEPAPGGSLITEDLARAAKDGTLSGTLWELEYSDDDGYIIDEERWQIVWAFGGGLIYYAGDFGSCVSDMLHSDDDEAAWARALQLAYSLSKRGSH